MESELRFRIQDSGFRNQAVGSNKPECRILNSESCQKGFTLLELLIVLVIIGVVVAALTLSIKNSGTSQESRSAVNILRARMLYAEQRALITSTAIGLGFSAEGYQFYRLETKPPSDAIYWQTINDNEALNFQAWPKDMDINLSLTDNPNVLIPSVLGNTPQLTFNPSGGVTPFKLKVDAFTLQGDANGEIKFVQG